MQARTTLLAAALAVGSLVPAFAAKPTVATAKLKIAGMHCQGCAGGIVNQFKKVNGIKDVKIDAGTKLGVVKYDPALVKPADLVAVVKKSGFEGKLVK
jgi:copper chaperone CopZ